METSETVRVRYNIKNPDARARTWNPRTTLGLRYMDENIQLVSADEDGTEEVCGWDRYGLYTGQCSCMRDTQWSL